MAAQPRGHVARRPFIPLPQAAPGRFTPRSSSNRGVGFQQTLGVGAPGMHLKRGNFPFCILPKHLTGIKVAPQENQFRILKPNFFPAYSLSPSLSVSDSKRAISSEIKPRVRRAQPQPLRTQGAAARSPLFPSWACHSSHPPQRGGRRSLFSLEK